MLVFLLRGLVASAVARGVLLSVARGIGGAAASGIGWKLGVDAYDAVKRWAYDTDEVEPD